MANNSDAFAKDLATLRELVQKGSDADQKKINTLIRPMAWDVQDNFNLPMSTEHKEFIKILATFEEAVGPYWKGYGDAWTAFLLRLPRSTYQESTAQENLNPSQEKSDPAPQQPVHIMTNNTSKIPDGFTYD